MRQQADKFVRLYRMDNSGSSVARAVLDTAVAEVETGGKCLRRKLTELRDAHACLELSISPIEKHQMKLEKEERLVT